MPRSRIEVSRRRSLVDATIKEIGRVGSLDVTVGQIAKKAGVSSALAHHYFGSKDQIFLAAMRHILAGFRHTVTESMKGTTTPYSRVHAIVTASFCPTNFEEHVVSAWLNFYVKAQNSSEVQRLLHVYQRRLHSNLVYELRPLAGDKAQEIAMGLAALIDGLYVRQALTDGRPSPSQATQMAVRYLDMSLALKDTQ